MPPADVAAPPEQQASRLRRLVPVAVVVSVGTIVAVSVWHQVRGGSDLFASLRAFDLALLPLLVLLHLLMQAWWCLRFAILAHGLGFPVAAPFAQGVVTSGLFAAAVTPGRVGGEPWRIAMLVRRGASGAQASRIILADRAVDIVFFLTAGLTVILLLPSIFGAEGRHVQALAVLAMVGLVLIAAAVGLAISSPRTLAALSAGAARAWDRVRRRPPGDRRARIDLFFHEVRDGIVAILRTGKRRLAVALVLSLLLWTSEFTVLYVALRGFGHDVPFFAVFAAGVLLAMVSSVPVLPGGSGVAEVTALAVLGALAEGLTPAFLVVWRGCTYYLDLVLGGAVAGAVLRRYPRMQPPPKDTASPADAH